MRLALQALTDELRRLKTSGVKTVTVSDEALASLRRVVAARKIGGAITPVSGREAGSVRVPAPSATVAAAVEKPTASPAIPVYEPPPPTLRTVAESTSPASAPVPKEPPAFQLPEGDKAKRWSALKEIVLADPTCRAHVRPGKQIVLGVGTLDAKIMFVGEAPGAEEEIQGEPFVGPAGQLLTKMIQGMGLKREDVYIGNIMNWRPEMPTASGSEQSGNRPPTEEEMRYCLPYLRAQIDIVNPDLLVALGKTASEGLLGFRTFKALGDVRGQWHDFAGKPLMVTYHPSYILREPTNRKKRLIWEDLLKVMDRSGLPVSEKQRSFFLDK